MLIENMVITAGVPVKTVHSSVSCHVIANKCKHLYLLVHICTHACIRRSANACTSIDAEKRRKHKRYLEQRHSTGEQVAIGTHQRSWDGVCQRALPASAGCGGAESVVHCPSSYNCRPPCYRSTIQRSVVSRYVCM